mgnify:CR=1 FL=1
MGNDAAVATQQPGTMWRVGCGAPNRTGMAGERIGVDRVMAVGLPFG